MNVKGIRRSFFLEETISLKLEFLTHLCAFHFEQQTGFNGTSIELSVAFDI